MICPNCNQKVKKKEKFCSNCSYEIPKENVKNEENKQSKNIKIILFISVFLLIMIGIIVLKMNSKKETETSMINSDENTEKQVEIKNDSDTATIPCDSSYTNMTFAIDWEDLKTQLDMYLQENYKNFSNIKLSSWNETINPNGTLTYTLILKKDDITFSYIKVEVEALTRKPTSVCVSYLQSDRTISGFASSEQTNHLKEISKLLNIEVEYTNFLMNIEEGTGDADYFENNVFSYYANDVNFVNIYITAITEEKKDETIESWYSEEYLDEYIY